MRKLILGLLVVAALSTSGCLKSSSGGACSQTVGNPSAPTSEVQALQAYITGANIQGAIQHSSGMFYTIIDGGTGATPGQCNAVAVRYTGKLTNGTIFDQATTPQAFDLYGLITGWRIGIPLIKAGGTIRLFIPPSLGYGSRQVGSIPANSILIFDIDLVNVG